MIETDVALLRERIDALDDAIARLLNERASVSSRVQASRVGSGASRVDLKREREVIARYESHLGREGKPVGAAVLTYCRGGLTDAAHGVSERPTLLANGQSR